MSQRIEKHANVIINHDAAAIVIDGGTWRGPINIPEGWSFSMTNCTVVGDDHSPCLVFKPKLEPRAR